MQSLSTNLFVGISVSGDDDPPIEPALVGYKRQPVIFHRDVGGLISNAHPFNFGGYCSDVVVKRLFISYTETIGDYSQISVLITTKPILIPATQVRQCPTGALILGGN